MKTKFPLYKRVTHMYRLGYDHLDEWEALGNARITEPKVVSDEGWSRGLRAVVEVPPDVLGSCPAGDIRQAIEASLDYGCRCEHDCCGCWSQYARAYRTKRREWVVKLTQSRNV